MTKNERLLQSLATIHVTPITREIENTEHGTYFGTRRCIQFLFATDSHYYALDGTNIDMYKYPQWKLIPLHS
jgi:hypothetical protein